MEKLAKDNADKIAAEEFDQEVIVDESAVDSPANGGKSAAPVKKIFRQQVLLQIQPVAGNRNLGNTDNVSLNLKSFLRSYETQRPLIYLPEAKMWFTYLLTDEDFSLVARRRLTPIDVPVSRPVGGANPEGVEGQNTGARGPGDVISKPVMPIPAPVPNFQTYGTWGRSDKSGTIKIDFRDKQLFTQSMLGFKDLAFNTLPKVTVFVLNATDYSPIANAQLVVTPQNQNHRRLIFRQTNKYGVAGFRAPKTAKFSLLVPGGTANVEIKNQENYALILVSPLKGDVPVPVTIGSSDPDYTR